MSDIRFALLLLEEHDGAANALVPERGVARKDGHPVTKARPDRSKSRRAQRLTFPKFGQRDARRKGWKGGSSLGHSRDRVHGLEAPVAGIGAAGTGTAVR